jgi:hypothetical protein
MANEPVYGWNEYGFAKVETVFGTAEAPVAASGVEFINADLGPVEAPDTRAKKDKTLGRDMTLEFVGGRYLPVPFTLETSVKSRATAATAAKEGAYLKAGGMVETIGATAAYTITSDPTIVGLTMHRAAGPAGTSRRFAELGYGGVIKTLSFSGGDSELILKAGGAFAGKSWQGQALATASDGSTTSIQVDTAAEVYRFGPGYYQIESEIVIVTAVNYSTGVLTATRAQVSTSGVAHAAATIYPYLPAPTLAGSPISEANCTVTLDGTATRCTKFSIDIETGIDHLPPETGSARVQGARAVRVDVKPSLEFVLTKELVNVLGKAHERKSVALTIVCGTGAGSIVTFSMPTCELVAMPVPMPPNDITIVSPTLRVRGSAGNDMVAITYS